MLHTKSQGHWPFGSGKEDFWRVFTIYGRGSQLGHVTQTPWRNFRSPIPLRLHMKFGFDWPGGFGEDLWKWWMDNGRTDNGPWLYYKLTNEPKGSGELKKSHIQAYRKKIDLDAICDVICIYLDFYNFKPLSVHTYFINQGLFWLENLWEKNVLEIGKILWSTCRWNLDLSGSLSYWDS